MPTTPRPTRPQPARDGQNPISRTQKSAANSKNFEPPTSRRRRPSARRRRAKWTTGPKPPPSIQSGRTSEHDPRPTVASSGSLADKLHGSAAWAIAGRQQAPGPHVVPERVSALVHEQRRHLVEPVDNFLLLEFQAEPEQRPCRGLPPGASGPAGARGWRARPARCCAPPRTSAPNDKGGDCAAAGAAFKSRCQRVRHGCCGTRAAAAS